VQLNGASMGICPESDGENFCDTNCLFITKKLAEEAGLWWLIPQDLHVIDDRVMWDTLIHATDKITNTGISTVFYRTSFEFHYRYFNVAVPPNTKVGNEIAKLAPTINNLQKRAQLRFRNLNAR
jgi:hypothetical protein